MNQFDRLVHGVGSAVDVPAALDRLLQNLVWELRGARGNETAIDALISTIDRCSGKLADAVLAGRSVMGTAKPDFSVVDLFF